MFSSIMGFIYFSSKLKTKNRCHLTLSLIHISRRFAIHIIFSLWFEAPVDTPSKATFSPSKLLRSAGCSRFPFVAYAVANIFSIFSVHFRCVLYFLDVIIKLYIQNVKLTYIAYQIVTCSVNKKISPKVLQSSYNCIVLATKDTCHNEYTYRIMNSSSNIKYFCR